MPGLTTVVNLRHQPYDVYIGRPSLFGNPVKLGSSSKRGATIAKFKEYFLTRIELDPVFREGVLKLKGKTLGCFCKPEACHGDVIVEYLETANGTLPPL